MTSTICAILQKTIIRLLFGQMIKINTKQSKKKVYRKLERQKKRKAKVGKVGKFIEIGGKFKKGILAIFQ